MATSAALQLPASSIVVPGQLTLRTIHGRNGPFNVGRLVTPIGRFAVKDAELEQYPEGKYDGEFVIRYIDAKAARRSWHIGQKLAVKVIYLGYAATSQMTCLALMARKIMVSQSTSGDVPGSGLDVLNQDSDSVEVALARQLVAN